MTADTTYAPPLMAEPTAAPAPPQRFPWWPRAALAVLLAGTAVLYLWGLGASGYANDFYAAAVQAGTQSWKAWFFGSLDSANFITVDKPPAALWVMGLSGRILGFNSWSMLVPQALEGVAAVALLHAAVKRWFGPVAGLLAGAVLALTPVAVLMFRFNNPDALLVLLLVAAAYATTRAVEKASGWWLVLAGSLLGFGFLTKMLQAFLVLPGFALVYLVAAPTTLRRRILHLLSAGGALVVSAGWWVATVQLWPASSRPYIGGSTGNSVLGLAFGYNGLGRVFGQSGMGGGGNGGGFGGGGMGGGFGGATGITRMFSSQFGTQISWLLPAALILLVALAWLSRRAARTDRTRAAVLLWGGWLLVTGGVFSYMSGIIHPYYTVALAPAIGALAGIGAVVLWRRRETWFARGALALAALATGWWGYRLLGRDADWHPWLRAVVLLVGIGAAAALLVPRPVRRLGLAAAVLGLVTLFAGTAAYGLPTAATPHTGSIPSAGPAGATNGGMGGPGGGMGGRGNVDGVGGGQFPNFGSGSGNGNNPFGNGGPQGMPGGGSGNLPDTNGGAQSNGGTLPDADTVPGGDGSGQGSGSVPDFGGQGGGAMGGQATSSELAALLRAAGTRWSAATTGDQSAAGMELASGTAVMAIGGWSGSDPAPTLAQFQQWVRDGDVHYYVGGGGMGGSGIAGWVQANFTAITVGGQTVYDLTKPASN
jgi:4-amino-4-deoxy-L-arabinose transferase-like glycosyltransferase